MKAIILAAGLGSRLNNITKHKPKALVEVNGVTMLEIVISKLISYGVKDFLINIHHFSNDIEKFLERKNNFGVNITISDESKELLDTGGAILKAKEFIHGNEPILIHNVDIISDFDITNLLNTHIKDNSIATLCVRKRNSTRGLLFNEKSNLVGWTNISENKIRWVNKKFDDYNTLAYSGIYMINPLFVDLISQTGKFSIINTWLDIAKSHKIVGYIDESPTWHDLGTIEKINNAEKSIKK